ncbi:glycoside hydrolase family 2 protein [Protaetiibacter larvae]|uniref:beta-mannosidase n=1 Tax=Protaetiibacter larvae TaxID=2592654 RepID=A0A5C1Y9G4_9MICO|nr:glycoside hydrolase family 2 protein [Protaetiibacter larvae]
MRTRELHEGWTVRAAGGPAPAGIADAEVPAVVPGVVHQALLDAGLIPDPYLDDNEAKLAWIGLVDWSYRTRLVPSEAEFAAERLELAFDGLDTVASITLDGELLAEVANQHRRYRLDVTGRIRPGGSELVVAFRSPVRYANAQSLALGVRPRPYPMPYDAIRKSACSFGWDWGIATYTSGIWRAVRLEAWSTARLAEVRVHAAPEGDGGVVTASVEVDRASDTGLELELEAAGASARVGLPAGERSAEVRVELPSVERWWPVGYGSQPLYDVAVRLYGPHGPLDGTSRRVGFRTLRWDTAPDAAGHPFQLIVNDRPVWVKGANWIPDDALPSRIDRARYERRLRQAVAANLNLVRVWGGGIYESDDFYELCDELGLLSWQDFLFACAAYPEEEPLRSEVAAEAHDNVVRLAHHASLALFTGNNENLWGFEDWDWKRRLEGRSWGAYYYHELFPAVIAELAPHVPYTPGSPFSPDDGRHPNDESSGSTHLWEQWNRRDWASYREHTPRFVAEFGWQGPPVWSTLTRALSDDPLTPESPGMIGHQKAIEGNQKLSVGLVPHYRVPDDMDAWHWAMQLNQANAVSAALDHFRSHAPHTSGAIVWQLNDCWPVTSWAAIDGDEREKPLFFALANAFAPRVVTVQPREGGLVAVLGNDADEEWVGELVFARRDFGGDELAAATVPVSVAARAAVTVPIPVEVAMARDAASELLTAELGSVRGWWFFTEPRDSALDEALLEVEATAVDDGYEVTVTAATLARDVTLLVDKLDPAATIDRGLVTLLPGESVVFRVAGLARVFNAAAFADPRVLRSGNQLVAR